MKRLISTLLVLTLTVLNISPAYAKTPIPKSLMIDNSIQATIYSYKKTRQFVAVEMGFTNTSDKYIEFTPKEIYLDDAEKYSNPPLGEDNMRQIALNSGGGLSTIPAIAGVGLGIGALAASIGNNSKAAAGLAIAALGMGGIYILSKGLENSAQQKKLVAFESNTFSDIKRLPPGVTLGGMLYFPYTKKEKSITIVAKSKSGKVERHVFELSGLKRR